MCVGEQGRPKNGGPSGSFADGLRSRSPNPNRKFKQKHSSMMYDEEEQDGLLECDGRAGSDGGDGSSKLDDDEDWLLDMPRWKLCTLLVTFFVATTMLGYEMGTSLELPHFMKTSSRSDLASQSDGVRSSGKEATEPTHTTIYGYELGDELEELPDFYGGSKSLGERDPPSFPLYNETFAGYLTHGMKEIMAANKAEERKHKKHYVYDSYYEKRWPESSLPKYLRKTIPYNRHIPNDKEICYVHVGKAGGSTVGCMLGFSIHCDEDYEVNGLLPIVTTHGLHRGVNDCPENAAFYLFVVRDPLARLMSAFNYGKPDMTLEDDYSEKFHDKELYHDCNFWRLEELAQNGLLSQGTDETSSTCRNRAMGAVTGEGKYFCHSYFNYQYYSQTVFHTDDNVDASTVPENTNNMLVIRNKHIVDDWNSINGLIGGKSDLLTPDDIPVNNAHAKNATELYLSDSSKMALCLALCNEIQVYKDIIRRAVNLNEDDIAQTMDELRESCPKEANESTCPEERPNMHHRIEDKRGELN